MFSKITCAFVLIAVTAGAQTPSSPRSAAVAKPAAGISGTSARKASKPAAPSTAGAQAETAEQNKSIAIRGKRDPFVSIIQSTSGGGRVSCASGKKCLVIDQVVLKGIVKGPEGMIALIENQQRKSYFLREKDPVFNGEVVRINSDSILFRERVVDKLGRQRVREIVKRIDPNKPA